MCEQVEGEILNCTLINTHFDRPFTTPDTEQDLQMTVNLRGTPVKAFGYYKIQEQDNTVTAKAGDEIDVIVVSEPFMADLLGDEDEGEDSAAYMSTLSAAVIVGLSALFL